MSPERSTKVNGNLVEEFYWNGKMVVYVNNRKFEGTYTEAVQSLTPTVENDE